MTPSGAEQPQPGLRITLRDLSILETLHTTPYLRSDQIRRLFWREEHGGEWGRVKACQQRLALLCRHGYVRRIEQPVKRGDGSKHFIYALDRKGADLLIAELGVEPQDVEWRPRSQEEHFPFLEHLLATVDLRIALVDGCAQTGVVLQEWLDEKELKRSQNVDRVTLMSPHGNVIEAAVVPDAYFMLCREGKYSVVFCFSGCILAATQRCSMPKPSPLPRKYAALVEESQANLRLIAQKVKAVLAHLEANQRVSPHVPTALREIEALSYRTALDLAEIEVANGCDGCPSAPPRTAVQAHLLVLADTLERHAAAARQAALRQPYVRDGEVPEVDDAQIGRNGTTIRLLEG